MMFNKKAFVIFVFLTVLIVSISAYSDFHAIVGSGNDTWNFGLGENYDDQLSYSVHSKVTYNRFSFDYQAGGYTNRGWKKDNKFYSGRFDRFDFLLGYDFEIPLTGKLFIEFVPRLGAGIVGDFGLDWYQNWVHKTFSINTVNLPYDYEKNVVHFAANGDLSLVYDTFVFGNSQLQTILFFNTNNAFSFESSELFGLKFAFQNELFDYKNAYLFVGYGLSHSFSGNVTEKLYADNIKGFTYGFGMNSGFISLDYSKYLNSGYGYSLISFDIAPLFSEKTYRKEDFWVSVGKCLFLDRSYCDNQIGYKFDSNISLVVKNRYANGYPILNDSEKDNIIVRYKRNYSLNSLGLRYQYTTKPRGVLTLYSQLNFGLSKWNRAILHNMDESAFVAEDGHKKDYMVFLDFELGLNLLPEKLIVCQNAEYQLNLFGGFVLIPKEKLLTEILITDNSHGPDYKFKGFAPYAGIALHVGIDV